MIGNIIECDKLDGYELIRELDNYEESELGYIIFDIIKGFRHLNLAIYHNLSCDIKLNIT